MMVCYPYWKYLLNFDAGRKLRDHFAPYYFGKIPVTVYVQVFKKGESMNPKLLPFHDLFSQMP